MNFDQLVRQARLYCDALPDQQRTELAAGQQPVALFITCSDSRIIPANITGAEPGKLFELRTAGNVVPRYLPDSASAEMATIEYAVLQLNVPEIVICGHSHCGAVTALTVAGRGLDHLPALRSWLGTDGLASSADVPQPDPAVRAESKQHLRAQLERLYDYPFIRQRIEAGALRVHGWFYEIDTGLVYTCGADSSSADFVPL